MSVILPTYNRAESLSNSIDSVLEQTYTDFELVVVDDASTDDTEGVVNEYGDSRLRFVQHDVNRGVSAARNTGIQQARGDILAFQDSDDEWFPEKLAEQMDIFEAAPSDVGVVYTGMHRIVDGEKRYVPYPGVEHKEGDIQESLVRQNFISTQMAAVRRTCFEDLGTFDEEIPALVDWELWLRLSEDYRFRLVDEPLVEAEVNPDSLSADRDKKVAARAKIVDKHRDRFDNESLAKHYFHIGSGAMRIGRGRQGRRYLLNAVRTSPKPLYVAAFCSSFFGGKGYTRLLRIVKRITSRPG